LYPKHLELYLAHYQYPIKKFKKAELQQGRKEGGKERGREGGKYCFYFS
jgi:hypothetical protein